MIFKYNQEKNIKLLSERGIGFEDIISTIKDNQTALSVRKHPNNQRCPNQQIMIIKLNNTVYVVPFIREPDGALFLKTIYPSTKARRLLLEKIKNEK